MSNFVDEAAVCVRGGDGGAGCVSFRREAHTPKGGPDGGDGGAGGSVWLVADRNVSSLLAFRDHPHRTAQSGAHGQGKKKHGASGDELMVHVPIGTVVKSQDGQHLADLVSHGDRWIASEGGRGGKGNAKFLSNRMRAPSFAEQGEAVEEQWLKLELKLMADVALVGFPNVGKSTFISAVSAAKPKIANYPFTTLVPNLGVVRLDDNFEMVIADIPGLIEGAADGKGLGHQFLRHIERARVIAILLDAAEINGVSTAEQEEVLLRELGNYEPEMLDRPRVRLITKVDVVTDEIDADGAILVSAVTGQNLQQALGAFRGAVDQARTVGEEDETYVVHRPAPEGISVVRTDDGGFEVVGREARRAVALSDLTNPDAVAYAQRRLRELGVDKALAKAGAKDGDSVVIGKLSFDYDSADQVNEGLR